VIAMSAAELHRRLKVIECDRRIPPQRMAEIQRLAARCAEGGLRDLCAQAGLFSNAQIASAFGIALGTASKWQGGAILIPVAAHLMRLDLLIRRYQWEAA
jgi:hypothetical protein